MSSTTTPTMALIFKATSPRTSFTVSDCWEKVYSGSNKRSSLRMRVDERRRSPSVTGSGSRFRALQALEVKTQGLEIGFLGLDAFRLNPAPSTRREREE